MDLYQIFSKLFCALNYLWSCRSVEMKHFTRALSHAISVFVFASCGIRVPTFIYLCASSFFLKYVWLNSLMLFFDFSIHGMLPNSCSISIHNGFIHLMVTLPLRSRVAREWRNCSKVTREAKEGGAPAAESSGQTKIQRQNPICAA